MNKDVRKFIQSITHIPGVEAIQGGKHVLVLKDGALVSTLPLTPSDHRWERNARAELRGKGITPNQKLDTVVRYKERLSLAELGARFRAMERGQPAAFARFIVEDVPALAPNLHNFKNAESAAVSIGRIAHGAESVRDWTHELLDFSLRAWDRVESQKARTTGAPVEDLFPLPGEPEAWHGKTEEATITVQVNVSKLLETLAELGITVVTDD